jgi:antitoxin ParD1/3/4
METPRVISVDLPPDTFAFVHSLVASGKFASTDDVVNAALQELKDQADAHEAAVKQLNADVALGCDQIRRGDVFDGDDVLREVQEIIDASRAKSA